MHMLIGLLILPVVLILNLHRIGGFIATLFKGIFTTSLADERHRITFETGIRSGELDAERAARKQIRELIDADDWVALARLIEDWDQNRTACPVGIRLYEHAISEIALALATAILPADECSGMATPIIPDSTLSDLENLAAMHAKHYSLRIICAQLRIEQGWSMRGGGYAHTVGESGWQAMNQTFARAAWLLQDEDPNVLNSPFLAATIFQQVAFMDDVDKKIGQFYTDWSMLDPTNQTPHMTYAFYLLPRWYGSFEILELEARKAAARTQEQTGAAAYASFYRAALEHDEYAYLLLDTDFFAQGIDDIIALRGRDPRFIAKLIQQMHEAASFPPSQGLNREEQAKMQVKADALLDLSHKITRTHLTGILPSAWDGGTRAALDYISEACKEEIDAGATFTLDDNGLTIHPAHAQVSQA